MSKAEHSRALPAAIAAAVLGVIAWAAPQPSAIRIVYPAESTLFPPDFAAPAFLFRDETPAVHWKIETRFTSGGPPLGSECACERMRVGEIDPRAVSDTNRPPELTPELAAARVWKPDARTWSAIRQNGARGVEIVFTGLSGDGKPVSSGHVSIGISQDPVGAPIFYRDVPLMPSELEKGVIKPLAQAAVPLIAWRLKNVSAPGSRVVMEGLHTCANCHSFSRDGRTLGMDLDGPRNDKGLYTLAKVAPRMTITNNDVIAWSSFSGKLGGSLRVGFMSQVSPDGETVVTMIEGPPAGGISKPEPRKRAGRVHFYVQNFKDYRFLQVFYPTRGILAWYSRKTGMLQPLPGADDPRYVHTNAVWSPDGKYLVFARSEAREPYPEGRPAAGRANDPNETPVRYDLYRIPFNEGRGGRAEPVAGASTNGASNSFPKISPDGRWLVFVKANNGLLMRPDGRLFIVPAAGGEAREMRANLPLMNSWHSFSPNGRWMVFSSKARSPYTQMYLTHIDEEGRDSPAILIEDATAANRAVNIPEFVNMAPDGDLRIDVPAMEFYRRYEVAWALFEKGQFKEAIAAWEYALELNPADAAARLNLGLSLMRTDRLDEAIPAFERAIAHDPASAEAYLNLGIALAGKGRAADAATTYRKALEIDETYAEAHSNLGVALASTGHGEDAIAHYRRALELNPALAEIHANLGAALAGAGRLDEAIPEFEKFVELKPDSGAARHNLGRALASRGRLEEAIAQLRKAVALEPRAAEFHNSLAVSLVYARRADEAVGEFEKAIQANPRFLEAHYNLGETLLYLQGKPAEALTHWRAVLQANPDHVPALVGTAMVLATSPEDAIRGGAEAVALAERAAQLTGGREPAVLDALAAAYAEAGRFPDAVSTAQKTLEMLSAPNANPQMVAAIRERLALYQAGKPARGR